MIKAIYEFSKIFAVLFLLTALFFATKGAFILAGIAFASCVIILLVNSDWFFDNFAVRNHNSIVAFLMFILITINVGSIWQEFQNSAMFVQLSDKERAEYVAFEKNIYNLAAPCVNKYNELNDIVKSGNEVNEKLVSEAHNLCYIAIRDIANNDIPETMQADVKKSGIKIKDDFKKIVVNISYYNYSSTDSQENVLKRLKENYSILKNDIKTNEKKWDIKKADKLSLDDFIKF